MLPWRGISAKLFLAGWRKCDGRGNDVRGENPAYRVGEAGSTGRKVVLTTGWKKTPVAVIVALKPVKERAFDLFHHPNFDIPADFDELSEASVCQISSSPRVSW
jgi:hypothetical protein